MAPCCVAVMAVGAGAEPPPYRGASLVGGAQRDPHNPGFMGREERGHVFEEATSTLCSELRDVYELSSVQGTERGDGFPGRRKSMGKGLESGESLAPWRNCKKLLVAGAWGGVGLRSE